MSILAIANQKGGVGKTTTAINLATSLGLLGFPTLLVDCDPQANTTTGLGVDAKEVSPTLYNLLLDSDKHADLVFHTEWPNLSLIPSNVHLVGFEVEMMRDPQKEFYLKKALRLFTNDFEFIILDCPPSLGLLTLNALVASDGLLIPLQCEFFSLDGLSQLLRSIRIVRRNYNPSLSIEGILLTMFDGRNRLSHQVAEEVSRYFSEKVFKTIIPRNVRLSEAPSYGQPIYFYDRRSKGAVTYLELAAELLIRKEKLTKDQALKKITTLNR